MALDDLIIVDCQYDFIDGTLACQHSKEAVTYLVDFINSHGVRCLYTSDWHSPTNGSFKIHGGIWPVHCVAGTHGAELHADFSKEIQKQDQRPNHKNLFLKSKRDDVEEYSAFNGQNQDGKTLHEVASSHVYVGGIASEYCVKETVLALLHSGRKVTLLSCGLGYVSKEDHEKALEDMKHQGVEIL